MGTISTTKKQAKSSFAIRLANFCSLPSATNEIDAETILSLLDGQRATQRTELVMIGAA